MHPLAGFYVSAFYLQPLFFFLPQGIYDCILYSCCICPKNTSQLKDIYSGFVGNYVVVLLLVIIDEQAGLVPVVYWPACGSTLNSLLFWGRSVTLQKVLDNYFYNGIVFDTTYLQYICIIFTLYCFCINYMNLWKMYSIYMCCRISRKPLFVLYLFLAFALIFHLYFCCIFSLCCELHLYQFLHLYLHWNCIYLYFFCRTPWKPALFICVHDQLFRLVRPSFSSKRYSDLEVL